jgi:hypothetical protein
MEAKKDHRCQEPLMLEEASQGLPRAFGRRQPADWVWDFHLQMGVEPCYYDWWHFISAGCRSHVVAISVSIKTPQAAPGAWTVGPKAEAGARQKWP